MQARHHVCQSGLAYGLLLAQGIMQFMMLSSVKSGPSFASFSRAQSRFSDSRYTVFVLIPCCVLKPETLPTTTTPVAMVPKALVKRVLQITCSSCSLSMLQCTCRSLSLCLSRTGSNAAQAAASDSGAVRNAAQSISISGPLAS